MDNLSGLFRREIALETLKKRLIQVLGHEGPRQRTDYAEAISNIADFLKVARFPDRVGVELMNLVRALDELDTGTVRPFLKPSKVGNRNIDGGDTWMARCYAAIALQVLIDGGLSRTKATFRIARMFPEIIALLSPGSRGDPADVLADWHKRFERDEVKATEARIAWAERGKLINHMQAVFIKKAGVAPSSSQLAEFISREAVMHSLKQAAPENVAKALEASKRVRRNTLKNREIR